MTYTFTKALGGKIGKSLLEADKQELALEILKKAKAKGVNIIMPGLTGVAYGAFPIYVPYGSIVRNSVLQPLIRTAVGNDFIIPRGRMIFMFNNKVIDKQRIEREITLKVVLK